MTRVPGSQLGGYGRRVAAAAIVGTVIGLSACPTATPAAADPVKEASWFLDAMQVKQAHQVSKGEGVVVAVVDTGVDVTHRDLADQVLAGTMFGGEGSPHVDTDGHGTAMASLIAGKGGGDEHLLGVAPAAKILPVRLAEATGGGNYIHDVYQAVRWAIDNGAKVINLSLGAPEGFAEDEQAEMMRYALQNDVVLVAAAGNSGDGEVSYPAAIPGVVAVSGTKYGDTLWENSSRGAGVVVAAPGKDVPVATPKSVVATGYASVSGTSASTALVSGAAALIRSKYPQLSAGGVVNRLIKTARDLGAQGRDPEFGFGAVDAYAALTVDVPHTTTYPLALPPGVGSPYYPPPATNDKASVDGSAAARRRDRIIAITGAATFFVVVLALLIPLVRVSLRNSAPRAVVPAVGYGVPAVDSAQVMGSGMPTPTHHPSPPT